jgi:hypothetical protein
MAKDSASQCDWLSLVQEQAGGALSYAAVPRVGLWPDAPPLCRYAEYTADQLW